MGVMGGFGGPVSTTLFTETVGSPWGDRLVAAVFWRRTPSATEDAPMSWPWQAFPPGWSGSRDTDGGGEVLYHAGRGVVSVLGHEYQLPSDGATLLLLIDESCDRMTPPEVEIHTLTAPVHPRTRIDETLDKPARLELICAAAREEHQLWNRILCAERAVCDFLAKDAR